MTEILLTPDERSLIDEIDQRLAEAQQRLAADQLQRAGALAMVLRSRKLRDGNWDYRAGSLVRTDLCEKVQQAIETRNALDHEKAIALASEAIDAGVRVAAPYTIKSSCLGDLGRREEALGVIVEAMRDCPESEQNVLIQERGFQRLMLGRYAEGWKDWEYRQQRVDLKANLAKVWPDLPEWDGSPNRHVLVCAEKGLGDTVLFARYLATLAERNCPVSFLASKDSAPMAEYLRGYPNIVAAYSGDDSIVRKFDAWIALESLAQYGDGIPGAFEFRELRSVPKHGARFRVGLCWHGGAQAVARNRKPEDPALWPRFAALRGVRSFSLQLGERGPCADCLTADSSLAETAAAIARCDLVITVDTSIAHIAGSLGIPVWMPLHRLNYWPWTMTDAEHTIWYPSLRIFRQQGDAWSDTFDKIASELKELAHG